MRKEAIEILLIEDNPADLLLIGEMLSDSRYVDFGLTHAALLSEGLGKVSDRRFDAILVDLSLPDSRGFGTFESLREMAGDVPIIVLTGVDDEELGARTLQEGAQDYLLKSELSTSLLVRSIRYAIERHRAEIALRLRERQLADAQRMSRTGSWEWDADSESFSCSDELYRILGRDPHSIRSPDEFLMERSLAALAEPASKPFCAEERIVLPDGSVRFLLSRAEIITDRRGRVTRMLGTCQDITERKEAEEALRQSETRFRALIEKSSDGISILSPDGRFIYSSPASIKILGYSPEELVGRDAFHGVHPDDLERTRALYARLVEQPGASITAEYRVQHRDGTWRWVQSVITNLIDEPAVGALIGNHRDITERRQAEETRSLLASIVESSNDAIVGRSLDGRITSWNAAAERIYGYSAEEALGQDASLIMPGAEDDDIQRIIETLRSGERVDHVESTFVARDGRQIRLDVTISPIVDSDGKVTGASAIARDVTEHKRATEARERLAAQIQTERRRLRDLLASLPGLVWETSQDGSGNVTVEFVSEYLETLVGYSPAEWKAAPELWRNMVHHEDWDLVIKATDAVLREGGARSATFRMVSRDGRIVWVESQFRKYTDEMRGRMGLRGVCVDVTERKAAHDTKAHLAAIVEASDDAIIGESLEGIITSWNAAAERIYGLPAREAVGKPIEIVIPPELRHDLPSVRGAIVSGNAMRHLEAVRTRPDGRKTYLSLSLSPIRDESGNLNGCSVIARDITDQKNAEEELRKSEAEYRTLFETMAQGVLYQDGEGRIHSANPAAAKILGMSFDQMLGKRTDELPWQAIHEDGSEFLPSEFPSMAALRSGAPVKNVVIGIHDKAEGGHRWISVSAVPQYRAGEEVPSQVYTTFQDVTELKRTSETLRRQALVFEMIHDGVLVMDSSARIIDWNRAAERIFGYPRSEALGKTADFFASASGANLQREIDDSLLKAGIWQGEMQYVRKDQGRGVVETSIVLHRDSSGREIGRISVNRDITERKRSLEEQRRLTAILEATPDLVSICDAEGATLYMNRAGRQMLRLKKDSDALGLPLASYSPDWAADLIRKKGVPTAVKEGSWSGESALLSRTGFEIPVSQVIVAHRDPEGQLQYLSTVARDIRALKEVEEKIRNMNAHLEQRVTERTAQLEAANRELEAFSYSVSHDLRAPLRAIEGFSRIIVEDYASQLEPEGQRYFQMVCDSTVRMGRLIDDLLRFSRVSRQDLQTQKVDMNEVVRLVLAETEAIRQGRKIEIEQGKLPPAHGDPALIRQVYANLIGNAIKYTAKREEARIILGSQPGNGGETVYFVRDNGTGFDMRYAHKLFGVFQRLHRADEYEGTGVGLAIVQRIIRRHQGRVWVDAKLGEGAVFYFTLGNGAKPEEHDGSH